MNKHVTCHRLIQKVPMYFDSYVAGISKEKLFDM